MSRADWAVNDNHTYTVHLVIGAKDDQEAWQNARRILDMVMAVDFPETPNGYIVDTLLVTDTDDWAEHIDYGNGLCHHDGDTMLNNRLRDGSGHRVCQACLTQSGKRPYPIVDEQI